MSVDEVRSFVHASGASALDADSGVPVLYGTHRTARGRARLYLGFDHDRLVWFRNGEQRGWTGMYVGVKHDLCTGRTFGSLILHAHARWERAAVLLDGRPIAVLPNAPNVFLEIDVPTGKHRLSIAKQDLPSFVQEIAFDDAGAGVLQIEIE